MKPHEPGCDDRRCKLIETDLQMADDKTKVTDRAKMLKCRAFQLNE